MNKWIRKTHRWLSIIFTVVAVANIAALVLQAQATWLGLLALPPLILLMLSGLYLFALPYLGPARVERPADPAS